MSGGRSDGCARAGGSFIAGVMITLSAACLSLPPAHAAPASAASPVAQTITFKQPRVTGKGMLLLRKFAKQIAPSNKTGYKLDQVTVDVYINPDANEFTRTAAANMSNEVARKLVGWGVPRGKISRAIEGVERAQTQPATYDVEVKATGSGNPGSK